MTASVSSGMIGADLPLYEEAISASEPGRIAQARELETYVASLANGTKWTPKPVFTRL